MMGSGDSKKLQIFRQQACSVSRALWPADLRRSLATGKVAQQRRSMLISGKRWALLARLFRIDTSRLVIATSMFIGGTIFAALLLRLWYVLLIPMFVLTVLTLVTALPFLFRFYHTSRQTTSQTRRELKSLPGFPVMRRAPETPMPAAPLVRILETYDLSQTDVEHFLDTAKRETLGISETSL